MSMDPTTEAAQRLVVAVFANYSTADDDDDTGMDLDVIHGHQKALIASAIEEVRAERLDPDTALAELVQLVIGRLLLASGLLFRVAFDAFIADDPEDRAPHRAQVFAKIADGAASLLAVAESNESE